MEMVEYWIDGGSSGLMWLIWLIDWIDGGQVRLTW